MRTLKLKKSESHWIDVNETIDGENVFALKIKVDYPTLEQQDELDDLYSEAMMGAIRHAGELRKGNPDISDEELNIQSAGYINLKKFNQFKRLSIKYSLKDVEGSDEPLKIVNNELDKEQFENICKDKEMTNLLYSAIQEQTGFTNADKKK